MVNILPETSGASLRELDVKLVAAGTKRVDPFQNTLHCKTDCVVTEYPMKVQEQFASPVKSRILTFPDGAMVIGLDVDCILVTGEGTELLGPREYCSVPTFAESCIAYKIGFVVVVG